MPELPEVETVRMALDDAAKSRRIEAVRVSDKRLRWPVPKRLARVLKGARIGGFRRRGKYLLMDAVLSSGKPQVMLLHLGMSGSVRIYDKDDYAPRKHDHLVLMLSGGRAAVLNDPRRFGGVDLMPREAEARHGLLEGLGIEPLGNRLDGGFLAEAFRGKAAAVKTALLDQRIIAGIGNIYASEALFAAGISPLRKAGRVSRPRLDGLAVAIRDVLGRAIAAGGTSLRDHVRPGGEIGYFAVELAVYGREGEACRNCRGRIRAIVQTGRSGFYCPRCQK